MGQIVWRYGAQVYGVKKRCRKAEWHYTDKSELGEVEQYSENESRSRAIEYIKKNFKSVSKAYAKATLWTINGDFEQWAPFTKEHNLKFELKTEELTL